MKKLRYVFPCLIFILFIGCSKNEKRIEISEQTYIIQASNFSVTDISLTIKTSLENERSFTIQRNSKKDIYIQASAGEYVKFTVTNNIFGSYRILDSKGVTIANYESLPSATDNTIEMDFIAFPPNDEEKDFIQYKTGLAKAFGDNLMRSNYLLKERYYLQNGIKTINLVAQEPCTYNDEYRFIPNEGEFGNFSPQRLIFSTVIDKKKSSCSYGSGLVIPTNDISVIVNGSDTVSFPIWDRLAVDGYPSNMMYRQLIIDSIEKNGTLTMHREINDGEKEVFVYKPK